MMFLKRSCLILSLSVLSSLLAAACGSSSPTPAPTNTPAPLVTTPSPGDSAPAGVTIRELGGAGQTLGFQLDREAAAEFTQKTGIKVEVIAGPESSTDRLDNYQHLLADHSAEYDVFEIDVIWPGLLAQHLVDLKDFIPPDHRDQLLPVPVQNDTVDGRLVALPLYPAMGLLYYRTDLLKKYGFANPPATWDELEAQAKKIQEGERAAGNSAFWGFVWQGNAYEGLTCNALEWQVSSGGGTIIDATGTITVNNPKAAAAFERAKNWIGTISPPGVTTYQEGDATNVWLAGNAAFMRNWPYAYALGNNKDKKTNQEPLIKGKFDVTQLPSGGAQHAGTLGGWQLGVSKYSQHPKEAALWVQFLTSREHEKQRSIKGGYLPSVKALHDDPDVLQANPYAKLLINGGSYIVDRPANVSKDNYKAVSTEYFKAVHAILAGEKPANVALSELETKLKALIP